MDLDVSPVNHNDRRTRKPPSEIKVSLPTHFVNNYFPPRSQTSERVDAISISSGELLLSQQAVVSLLFPLPSFVVPPVVVPPVSQVNDEFCHVISCVIANFAIAHNRQVSLQ